MMPLRMDLNQNPRPPPPGRPPDGAVADANTRRDGAKNSTVAPHHMKWAKWVASGTLWQAGLHVALGVERVVQAGQLTIEGTHAFGTLTVSAQAEVSVASDRVGLGSVRAHSWRRGPDRAGNGRRSVSRASLSVPSPDHTLSP